MGKHGHSDPSTRFWKQVGLMPDGCLVWKGANQPNMSGQFCANSTTTTAHRWAWFFSFGTMPDRRLEHLCGNTWCVNVDHLDEKKNS